MPLASQIHRSSHRSVHLARWLQIYVPAITVLLMRVASSPTATLSYVVLSIFALTGRVQAIIALALSWLFTMINPMIVAEGSGSGAARYLVILAAALSSLMRSGIFTSRFRIRPFTLATIMLSVFFVVHSILLSPIPDVSILKAVSWGLTMTALVSLWLGLSDREFQETANMLFWGLAFVLVASVPFLGLPAGFAVNKTGFQGILNHPQGFGTTMAILGAWAGARMLGERRPAWALIGLTSASLVFVFLSEARTGGVAMLIGLGLSLVLSPVFAGRRFAQMVPGLSSGRVWTFAGAGLVAGLAMASTFSELVVRFLSKSGRAGTSNLLDAYDASRGFLIDAMVANILNDPFRGIGFGIASYPSAMIVKRDPILGLPLGAAIEKGLAPLAVLEEVGLFGAVFVAAWLFWLLRKGAVGGLAPFAVCLTALVLNMGENTLFSPGGQGLLVMILFGWIYGSGERRKRHG